MATDRNIDVRLRINATNLAGGAVQSLNTQVGTLAQTSEKLARAMQTPAFAGAKFLTSGQDNVLALNFALQALQKTLGKSERDGARASEILSPITPMVQQLKQARGETKGLGEDVTSFALGAIPAFANFSNTLSLVETLVQGTRGTLTAKIGTTFFDSVAKTAKGLSEEIAPLSDFFKGIAGASSPAIGGFLGVGDSKDVTNSINKRLGTVAEKMGDKLVQGFDTNLFGKQIKFAGMPNFTDILSRVMAPTYGVGGMFAPKIPEGMSEQRKTRRTAYNLRFFNQQKDLIKKFVQGGEVSSLGDLIRLPDDGTIANTMMDMLPSLGKWGLNNESRVIKELFRAKDISVLGNEINQVVGGIVSSTLTEGITPALRKGFNRGFQALNRRVGEGSVGLTAKAVELAAGDFDLQRIFQDFDRENKGQASKIINQAAPELVQRFTNNFGAAKIFPRLFEYLFTYVPASATLLSLTEPINKIAPGLGHAITTLGDDYFGQFIKSLPGVGKIFPTIGRTVADTKFSELPGSKNIAKFYGWLDTQRGRNGAFGKLAGQIADYGFRSIEFSTAELFGEIADTSLVNPLLTGLTKNTAQNAIGMIVQTLQRMQERTPDFLKNIIGRVMSKFPNQLAAIQQALGKDISRVMGTLFSPFTQSDYQARVFQVTDQLKYFDADKLLSMAQTKRKQAGRFETERRYQRYTGKIRGRALNDVIDRTVNVAQTLDGILNQELGGNLSGMSNQGLINQMVGNIAQQVIPHSIQGLIKQVAQLPVAGRTSAIDTSRIKPFADFLGNQLTSLIVRNLPSFIRNNELGRIVGTFVNRFMEQAVKYVGGADVSQGIDDALRNQRDRLIKEATNLERGAKVVRDLQTEEAKQQSFRGRSATDGRLDNLFRNAKLQLQQVRVAERNLRVQQEVVQGASNQLATRIASGASDEDIQPLWQLWQNEQRQAEKLSQVLGKVQNVYNKTRQQINALRTAEAAARVARRPQIKDETLLAAQAERNGLQQELANLREQEKIARQRAKRLEELRKIVLGEQTLRQDQRSFLRSQLKRTTLAPQERQGIETTLGQRRLTIDEVNEIGQTTRPGQEAGMALQRRFANAKLTTDEIRRINGLFNQRINETLENYREVPEKLIGRIQGLVDRFPDIAKQMNIGESFLKIDTFLEGTLSTAFAQLGRTAAIGMGQGLVAGVAGRVMPTIDVVDKSILGVINRVRSIPGNFVEPSRAISDFFFKLQPVKIFSQTGKFIEGISNQLFVATQKFALFGASIQGVQSLIMNSPISKMVAANAELEAQVLTIQSGLIATNRIIAVGANAITNFDTDKKGAIKDPRQALSGVKSTVDEAINYLRLKSLEISKVTSADLMEPFLNVINQSGQLGLNIKESVDLAVSFSAAMTTLNVPIHQNRQEIQSILTASITHNSMVAKTLGITNQQVRVWRDQGRIYEELQKKLLPLTTGQAEVAKTLSGVTSNIQEFYGEMGRIAGAPLMALLKEEVQSFYVFLLDNKDAILDQMGLFINQIVRIAKASADFLRHIGATAGNFASTFPLYLLSSLGNILEYVVDSIKLTITILGPFLRVLNSLPNNLDDIIGPILRIAVTFKTLQFAIMGVTGTFGLLSRTLPVVGNLMEFVALRSIPAISVFSNLSRALSPTAAGFLVLTKNAKGIPGMMGLLTRSFAQFGPLAPALASISPMLAGIGINAVGLARSFGPFQKVLTSLPILAVPALQGVIKTIQGNPAKGIAGNALLMPFVDIINLAIGNLKTFNAQVANGTVGTALFGNTIRTAGMEFRKWVVITGAMTAALYGTFILIDEFILKNEQSREVVVALADGVKTLVVTMFQVVPAAVTLSVAITGLAVAVSGGAVAFGSLLPMVTIFSTLMLGGLKAMDAYEGKIIAISAALVGLTAFVSGFLIKLTGLGILNNTIPKLLTSLSALSSIRLASLATQVDDWARSVSTFPLPGMQAIGAHLADMSAHLATASRQFAIAGDASIVGSAKMSAAKSGIFALGAAAKSLVLALAPIAVTLAAVGTAALFVAEHKLRKSNEAFEATSRVTGGLSLAWIQLRRDLMAAGDAQEARLAAGIALGQKEYEENKKLQGRLKSLVFQTEGQIASLNERLSRENNPALKRAIQYEIDELTNRMEAYKGAADEITTAPAELRELGGVFRQLTGDADLFWQAVNNPGGDNDKLAEQAKNLIETTKKQFEMGAIDPEEAKKRLNFLLNTTTLGKDARIAAEQAITEIVKQEAERRITILTTEQNMIQGLMDEGRIGDIEGERRLSQSKLEELKIRAQAERDAFEERQRIRNLELQQELDAANKRAESIRTELQKPEMPVPEVPQAELDKLAQVNEQISELTAQEGEYKNKFSIFPSGKKPLYSIRAEIAVLSQDRDAIQAEIAKIEGQRSTALQNNLTDERKQQLEQELKGIEEERGRVAQQLEAAGVLDAKNTEKALAEIERQGFAERKKARERENKVLLQNYDEEQATLEQYLRFGETTIEEFNRRELEIAKGRYQQELAILREESSKLSEGNIEAQEAIFARSVEASKKYTEAQRRFWENESKRLEEDFKQQAAKLEIAVRSGEMTIAESNQRTFALNQERVDRLIEFNATQLKETFDPAMIQQLITREGELYKQRGDIVKQFVESETSRLRDEYTARSAILENALRNNEVTLGDYNEELHDLQRTGLDQQIAFLDEQIAVTTDPRLAQELLIKQQELLKQRLEATNTFIQAETDRITKGFEKQNAALEASYSKGNLTAQEYNEASYALVKERVAAQLQLIQSQLRIATDPRLIQDLLIKQQELMKQAMEATNTFIQAETERITKAFDEQNAALEAGYAQGNHTIEEYNQKSYEFIKQRIKAQLELIQSQLKLATDPRMLQQLRTQEQTLLKEQANAYDNFLETQKRQLERRLKESNDIIKASEVDRTKALQQLRNSGDVGDLEENQLKLDSTRRRIEQELKLEQQRIRELQALPTPNDPEKQLEREANIREARVRGSQLEIDLLTNEREQQRLLGDTIAKALQKRVDAVRNATTLETQELQRVIDLNEIYSKSLENQSKLFEARSNLQSAAGGYIQSQLELLKNVTKSERRQQQIAELTAAIKIRVLQQQIAMEQKVAEIQEQQRRLTLEREKINKRMELGQAQASASEAGMRYQELVARQAINPADVAQSDIMKAQLDLRAAQIEIAKKQNDLVALDAQGRVDQQLSDLNSTQKTFERQGRLNSALSEFANTGSPGRQRRRQRMMERRILDEMGVGNTRSLLSTGRGYLSGVDSLIRTGGFLPKDLVAQSNAFLTGVPQLGEPPAPPANLLDNPQFQVIDVNTNTTAENTTAIQGLTSAIAQLTPDQQARVAGSLATIQSQQRAGLLDMTRTSLQQIAPGYVSQINRGNANGTESGVAQNMIMGMREEINRLASVVGQPEFSNQINNYFDTSDLRSRALQQTTTQQTLEAIRDVSRETKRLFRN